MSTVHQDLATRIWELERRLAAAETVAYLYGICPAAEPQSDREAALNQAWRQWWDHPGVPHEVKDWPNLRDRDIAVLAEINRRHRADMKAKLDKLIEVVPPGTDD